MRRGFFEIGIEQGKCHPNLGMLWRSANIMGANGIFTIGDRYKAHSCQDTMKTPKHVPLREFDDVCGFCISIPKNTKIVGVELTDDSTNLFNYKHPERAIYVLGAEDYGLSQDMIDVCDEIIRIPFDKTSLNVAVAGSIIMYDRSLKRSVNKNNNSYESK